MIAAMNYGDHVTAVEREVAFLAGAFVAGPIDTRVPTCPDWTLADLAAHVDGFTGFWSHVLCEGTGRPKTEFTERPVDRDIGAWYAGLAPGRHLPPRTQCRLRGRDLGQAGSCGLTGESPLPPRSSARRSDS
jgi:hypothetical protein